MAGGMALSGCNGKAVLVSLVALLSVIGSFDAAAVIDAKSAPLSNTNAPTDGSPWLNVGQVNGSSGIYLGDRWALTASHVGYGNLKLAGVIYPYDGINFHLTNSDGTPTDMFLFHLGAQPPLTNVTLASSTPTNGTHVDMIWFGRTAATAQTNIGIYTGFYWSGDNQKKSWANNKVSQNGVVINAGFGNLTTFATRFDQTLQTSHEGQAAPQDSGGGVFSTNVSGGWQLVGMLDATDSETGQPDGTAVYGNSTFSADIATYRNQIISLMTYGAPPALAVSKVGTNINVVWPAAGTGYKLEASGILPGTNWTALTPTLSGQGYTNLPATNAQRFFRLKKP